jgi:acyl-coenzyme A synthetase/AMP-(fatty) acid ligase
LFLVDADDCYSYKTLIDNLNNCDCYAEFIKGNSIFDLFLSIILALVNDLPLTLIDQDVSESDLQSIGIVTGSTTPLVGVNDGKWKNISSVVNRVIRSKSTITLFTSGTTGKPKQVSHNINTLLQSARVGSRYQKNVWGFAYNPTHIAGIQVFLQALLNQNLIVYLFNKSNRDIFKMIDRYNITHISATPTFYRLLLPADNTHKSVIRITVGGEKSHNKLYESMKAIFPEAKINNIYASTEFGSLLVSKGEAFQIPEPNAGKIKIEKGELLVHKSLVGISETILFEGDYYRTGDLIEWVDEGSGSFIINGRATNSINVGGYNVNPDEVEGVLMLHEDVIECVIYGKTNSVIGNILICDIMLKDESVLSTRTLREFMADKIQQYKIPRIFNSVDQISVTRTGKKQRI